MGFTDQHIPLVCCEPVPGFARGVRVTAITCSHAVRITMPYSAAQVFWESGKR